MKIITLITWQMHLLIVIFSRLNLSSQQAEPYFHIHCYPDIYIICLFKNSNRYNLEYEKQMKYDCKLSNEFFSLSEAKWRDTFTSESS